MIKDIFIAYKENKINTVITILAFTIFIFCSSIIYCMINDALSETKDLNAANENAITVTFSVNKNIEFQEIKKDLFSKFSKYGTIKVNLGRVIINGLKSSSLEAIDFEEKSYLNVNILSGKDFTVSDLSEKKALVGQKLEDCIINVDGKKFIEIQKERYEVIGIIGRKGTSTPYDLSVYIPLNMVPLKTDKAPIPSYKFSIYNNSKEYVEKVLDTSTLKESASVEEATKKNLISTFLENYRFNMDAIKTVFFTILVSIINLFIISTLWINNKKYEIAIKKALGASNKSITKEFFILILTFSLLASFGALILENLFANIIGKMFFIYLNITVPIIIFSSCFSFFISLLVALYQVRRITNVSITEYIQD